MIRRLFELLKNNKFSVILWLGVGFLLMLSSFERGFSFQSRSNNECEFEDILGNTLRGALGCGLPSAASPVGEDSGVRFEINVGQADSIYRFVASGRSQTILLSPSEAVFHMKDGKHSEAHNVHATLMGAGAGAEAKAENPLSGRVNYLIGNDPRHWRTDVPTFGRVRFTNVYPGIDVAYHGNRGDLETDFIVQPGADPQAIRIRF